MRERTALSKKIRFDVFKRDSFVCQYCGAHPPTVVLEVDHIVAIANGGSSDFDNLVTSCFNCNRGKGATPLDVIPQSLEEKAREVAEREEQLAGYAKVMEAKRERLEDDMWRVADVLMPGSSEKGMRKEYLLQIRRFIDRLGLHEALEAAEIANAKFPWCNSRTFRYFCGVCWRKVKDAEGGE